MNDLIDLRNFEGIIPRQAPKELPPKAAQTAENCDLLAGRLDPINAPDAATLTGWKLKALNPNLDVVQSPINEDQYERYYWTGAPDGKMKVAGTFAERDVALPIPDAPTGVSTAYYFDDPVNDLALTWYGGTAVPTVACPYASHKYTEIGLEISFNFPGQVVSLIGAGLCETPKYQLAVSGDGTGDLPGTLNCLSSITDGSYVALTDGTNKYAELQVVTVADDVTTIDILGGINIRIWNPYTVTLTINMNYTDAVTKYFYYVMTYVDDHGAEGPPSEISPFVTRHAGQYSVVSGLDVSTDPNIVKKRLYRSVAGTAEDAFLYLDEVANATTSYTDKKTDAELVEPLDYYGNPPDDMEGLVLMPGGWMAAFKGKDLYYSKPFLPNVWSPEWNMTVEHDIVGLASSGNDLVVLTTGYPVLVTGSHPEILTQTELMQNQSCVSKESICQIKTTIAYASPDGIVMLQGGRADLVSEKYFKREDWQAWNPSGMAWDIHDKRLYGFRRTVKSLDASPAVDEGGGTVGLPCTAHGFSAGDVITLYGTDNYDATYTVLGTSTANSIHVTASYSAETFSARDRVFLGVSSFVFDFDEGLSALTTSDEIAVAIFSDLEDDTLYMNQDGTINSWGTGSGKTLTWKSAQFQFDYPVEFNCGRIVAPSYPGGTDLQLRLYANGVLQTTLYVLDETAFRLPSLRPERVWAVEVVSTVSVDEVSIATSMAGLLNSG